MREIEIAGRRITEDGNAFVIAEIGHNHQGDLETAMRLFWAAKSAGCDAVKLQKRSNASIFTKALRDKPYNSEHAYGATYGEHREALELDFEQYAHLQQYAKDIGILFFATAFDEQSADFLEELDVPAYKIASGDLRNLALIEHVAKKGKPLIVSTGGGSAWDIMLADRRITKHGAEGAFLHCVAMYPTPPDRVNLSAIWTIRDLLPHRVIGYSCHYNGIVMAEMSYMYGARIIEKHFTLDHTMKGSDHALSLEPNGMRKLVRDLRRIRVAHGTGQKTRSDEEEAALAKMEKVLYPTRTLPAGHRIRPEDVAAKTPATPDGLCPWYTEDIIGKALLFDVSTAAPLTKKEIE